MWDWIQQNAWIVIWILLTPLMLFIGMVHYILLQFENWKLMDWDKDRWDDDNMEDLFK